MSSLRFEGDQLDSLRRMLLADAPSEAGAVLLAGSSCNRNGNVRLFVRDLTVVSEDAYLVKQFDKLEINPSFVAPLLKQARNEELSLVFAHTHPGTASPRFSSADERGELSLFPALYRRAPKGFHASLVLGTERQCARIRDAAGEEIPISEVRAVGRTLRIFRDEPALHISQVFDRNVRAFGKLGQQVLQGLRVGIVGLGGTGSLVAQALAHLGVENFVLIDPDRLELSNLNRVVGASTESVGEPKVQVAARLIERISAGALVKPIIGSIFRKKDSLDLLDVDLVFCCTDNHGSRAVLNQLAYQYFIPVIDMGVRIDARDGRISSVGGRVQMLSPGLPCLLCQRLLDAEAVRRDLLSERERQLDPYISGGEAESQPSVISLNGTVASLAVSMFLGTVTNAPLTARHQLYFADRGVVKPVDSRPDPMCIVCSSNGAKGRGDSWALPWRLD